VALLTGTWLFFQTQQNRHYLEGGGCISLSRFSWRASRSLWIQCWEIGTGLEQHSPGGGGPPTGLMRGANETIQNAKVQVPLTGTKSLSRSPSQDSALPPPCSPATPREVSVHLHSYLCILPFLLPQDPSRRAV
jgi:hypothetical protein